MSADPQFIAKAHDIVGLYMSPPEHASRIHSHFPPTSSSRLNLERRLAEPSTETGIV